MSFPYSCVIVWGANGMLGQYVVKYFQQQQINIIPVTRSNYDLQQVNTSNLEKFLFDLISHSLSFHLVNYHESSPQKIAIINCAGVIPHRHTSPESMWIVNAIFPRLLNEICRKHHFKLIHISTDCVYQGKSLPPPDSYKEFALHDESSVYGKSKSFGEDPFMQIVRTSIIGEELHNKLSLLEWLRSQQGKTIPGFSDHYWNGMTCLQLAKNLYKILEDKETWNGPRHFYSESVSKAHLLILIKNIYQWEIEVVPTPTTIVNKTLSTYTPELLLKYQIPPLAEQIREMAEFGSQH